MPPSFLLPSLKGCSPPFCSADLTLVHQRLPILDCNSSAISKQTNLLLGNLHCLIFKVDKSKEVEVT